MTSSWSRILVPLDGSASAETVLSHLRRTIPRHDVTVFLLQAIPLLHLESQDAVEKYLRRISFQLTNDGYPSRYLIRHGSAAEAILAAAAEVRAEMIAMTTHGRTGVERLVLGSVAERILQVSDIPVLVARSLPAGMSRGRQESLPIRNFLVPLDGSRLALGALEAILPLARPVDAHVTLLHVDAATPYDGRWESPDATLKEADQVLRSACIPARIEHRKGNPSQEILKATEEGKIDLVAMTTHGRSGPSRWMFGSVAAEVLRASAAPLLVVRRSANPAGENRLSRGETRTPSPVPE